MFTLHIAAKVNVGASSTHLHSTSILILIHGFHDGLAYDYEVGEKDLLFR